MCWAGRWPCGQAVLGAEDAEAGGEAGDEAASAWGESQGEDGGGVGGLDGVAGVHLAESATEVELEVRYWKMTAKISSVTEGNALSYLSFIVLRPCPMCAERRVNM